MRVARAAHQEAGDDRLVALVDRRERVRVAGRRRAQELPVGVVAAQAHDGYCGMARRL
jgi:hypothetical protein